MAANLKTCFAYQATLISCNSLPHYAQTKIDSKHYQWLTDGYYFWLNSDIYAKWWGKNKLKGKYLVKKYEICIERDKVLDLIENPDDEKLFFYFIFMYLEEYKKYNTDNQLDEPTVSTVITYMKKKFLSNFFLAIYITDDFINKRYYLPIDNKKWLKMIPSSTSKSDIYKPMGRPQVCVFEEGFQYIFASKE